MGKAHRILLKLRPYQLLIEWSKRITLPGFEQLPLYDVSSFFIKEIPKEKLNTRASSLAFSFLLAIFPATIFLFTVIPYIPINNFQDQLLLLLSQVLPQNAFEAMRLTLEDIIKHQNGGLLSIGFIAALFFSTNGLVALMTAFNKSSLVMETRGFLKQRLVAVMLAFILALVTLAGISLLVIGEYVIELLRSYDILQDTILYYSLFFIRWIAIIALFFFAISCLYYFGPATAKRFRFISAGATLATLLAILTSAGFSYYINNFGSYNKVYGSIGTLIVVMIWLYINSLILLIGFELNVSIHITKRNQPPKPQPKLGNQLREA